MTDPKKTEEIAEYLDIPVETVEDMAKPDPYDNDEYSRSYDDSGAFESDIEENYKKDFKAAELAHELRHEKSTHDTGGFRISDSDAKKAKARLKKKYGKFARHFREFNELQEISTHAKKRYIDSSQRQISNLEKAKDSAHRGEDRQQAVRLDKKATKRRKGIRNYA